MKHLQGSTNTLLVIVIVLLLLLISLLGYGIFKEKNTFPFSKPTVSMPTDTPTLSKEPEIAPTEERGITLAASPSGAAMTDIDQLKNAFAQKYTHTPEEVMVSISKNNGTHIWGSVKFEGEMGGGWFLAAKTNGKWIIVQDGNGTIDCATIKPYNFPTDMVSECWDAATQKLIKR